MDHHILLIFWNFGDSIKVFARGQRQQYLKLEINASNNRIRQLRKIALSRFVQYYLGVKCQTAIYQNKVRDENSYREGAHSYTLMGQLSQEFCDQWSARSGCHEYCCWCK